MSSGGPSTKPTFSASLINSSLSSCWLATASSASLRWLGMATASARCACKLKYATTITAIAAIAAHITSGIPTLMTIAMGFSKLV